MVEASSTVTAPILNGDQRHFETSRCFIMPEFIAKGAAISLTVHRPCFELGEDCAGLDRRRGECAVERS